MTSTIIIDAQNPADQFPEEEFDTGRDVVSEIGAWLKKSKIQPIPNIALFDPESGIHTNFDFKIGDSPKDASTSFTKTPMNEESTSDFINYINNTHHKILKKSFEATNSKSQPCTITFFGSKPSGNNEKNMELK